MTQIGEAISLSKLSHEDHDENTCAFCNATPEPTTEENTLVDDFDEDSNEVPGVDDAGLAHKNSSGKLAKALEAAGYEQISAEIGLREFSTPPQQCSVPLKVTTAAHHLIPGNASLKRSRIMKFLHTDGMAEGNIGYNVNNYENGVWLAGNYAMRGQNGMPKWGKGGKDFESHTKLKAYEYAKQAIEKTRTQFHDAHKNYSDTVLKALDLIAEKYNNTQDVWCTESSSSASDNQPQLPMLVMRLNTISRRAKSKLENPSSLWNKNIYTSEFSLKYIHEELDR